MDAMKLDKKLDRVMVLVTAFMMAFTFGVTMARNATVNTYAENEDGVYEEQEEHFVTFYDDGDKLIVKTTARTVKEALDKAGYELSTGDKVEPALNAKIDNNNFFINIYRARPALVKVGLTEKYVMTASTDARSVVKDAGITVYDGDEIRLVRNTNFLETGVATVYEVTRNGGRTITVETEIPFAEVEERDYNLASGQKEVRQYGEVGLKTSTYEVLYVDGEEASRTLISETVVREPVNKIVAVGVKKSPAPDTADCMLWARSAGVSESDLSAAIDLIYHESGCRVNARNASSGAYGIPQALPGTKMASEGDDWETNPITQIKWMIKYVNGRYGGWKQALEWWYNHGWY